jgi:hypothetical protein
MMGMVHFDELLPDLQNLTMGVEFCQSSQNESFAH